MISTSKKYSFNLRSWHWLNVVAISGSLLTVFLNATLFDQSANAAWVTKSLQDTGAKVTGQQAGTIVHGFREQVWELHVYAGYLLIVLLVYRLVAGLLESKDQTLWHKLKQAFTLYHLQKGPIRAKELTIKLLYVLFYGMLIFMAISGLCLKFDQELALSNSLKHNLEEMHGFVMYLILSFILLHIVGVIIAERTDKPGLVSDMINGGDGHESH